MDRFRWLMNRIAAPDVMGRRPSIDLITCMSSIPASVMDADQHDLNPNMGRVIRLIAR